MIQIEIIVPLSFAHEVKLFREQCCLEPDDLLLGYRVSQECNEVVCLVHDSHSFKHVTVLHDALQYKTITSFRILWGSVLKFSSLTTLKQIVGFPLIGGDSWFLALDDAQCLYLSIPRALMTGKQAAWLLCHENVAWAYL